MSQPILRTERIHLVPLSVEHLKHQIELDADPDVMRYVGGALTPEQAEQALREGLADAERGPGLGYWAGFVEGSFAGYWILRPPDSDGQDPMEGQGELGYRLLKRYWRQGLAKEGSRELLRYGFEDLGLTRIMAMAAAANEASRATMASVGLHHVRDFTADAGHFPPGTDLRGVEYALTRGQWNARN
ncbi:GNAT family N-acetyltransferase [Dactylosporangium fulvum]|uniref:GNAT family N-acetyltransferase n=1 Tax=Dactylosporangium fulvum TaxID=53359 RepID=A0ABY5VMQ8_9ACTN|nr:GNAT family N-acetyltransferase [Dactylosporangium fulvum]UWP78495.1 GNAT family N-acetyltransferase [Dactylosporangium fulvum]